MRRSLRKDFHMKHVLIKMSAPGWEKKFDSKEECRNELSMYICSQCRAEEGITDESSLGDMLSTACGCEFFYEVEE